jgi:Phosphoenolpyruvate carboxylase
MRGLEDAGFSRPLTSQITLLWDILASTAREFAETDVVELLEELTQACRLASMRNGYRAVLSRLQALPCADVYWLLRTGLLWFELFNAAEKQEIIRVNRLRKLANADRNPAPDSVDQAIAKLKTAGVTFEQLQNILEQLDIQPTLTSHPTETTRRTTRIKLQKIVHLLETLQWPHRTSLEEASALDDLRKEVALLLCTDDLRSERPQVKLEVERGISIVLCSIWDSVPDIYRSTQLAIGHAYSVDASIPAFLRFRSWIGGDRDGNPNVTPEVTRWTLDFHRQAALKQHRAELERLREELSLSDRRAPISAGLRASLEADVACARLDNSTRRRFRREPYRLKISGIMARIDGVLERSNEVDSAVPDDAKHADYQSAQYVHDLESMQQSLEAAGLGHVARRGRLQRVLWLARSFGFHLVALDIRQHSAVHERAVAAILQAGGVVAHYAALSETERQEILAAQLCNPCNVLDGVPVPAAAGDALALLKVVAEAKAKDSDSIGSYVISMSHAVSDALEVLLLAKEAGLRGEVNGRRALALDLVPLFETIEDLAGVEEQLSALLTHPVYRSHLETRGTFQEVMVGYSDSNKEGGFWMANWLLYDAQEKIARVCRKQGVDFRIFHGRGGSLERGGGMENESILAAAPLRHNGRVRFTEQGEVISFCYASSAMACRHLEQVAHAVILAMLRDREGTEPPPAGSLETFASIAGRAMTAYRRLIETPDFWPWFSAATPLRQIGQLPITSRPASRSAEQEIDFAGLRAIPWVFAWRQCRYAAPGWFGLGTALREQPADVKRVTELYRNCAFFRLIVDAAKREMARTRLDVAHCYSAFSGARAEERICGMIEEDFRETRAVLLQIGEQSDLLADDVTLRQMIAFRDPMIDVLNLLQIELLRRAREDESESSGDLELLVFLSIIGIAAAMECTG